MKIKIAIGCHSYLLGEGLKNLFRDNEKIDIIGIFDEGIDITEIIKLNPDIIIADFKIFRTFPADFINSDQVKFLLLSDRSWAAEAERQIPELIMRGVCGIMTPDSDLKLLKRAIKIIYSGELWIDRKIIKNILHNLSHVEKKVELTKKEREVVNLICHGYRNKEIAQKLDISEQTVKSHCNRIFKKVGVSDRLQLALYTHRNWPGFM